MTAAAARHSLPRLLLILGALLVLRIVLLALSRTELNFEEAQYWTWSQDLAFGYYSKPPLIAWLIRATCELLGDTPFAIRLAAPVLHMATALALWGLGRELYDERVGFWSAIVYATVPAVSFSSTLMTTDVPLLTAWAAALWAMVRLHRTGSLAAAAALGLALGLGLLAKYAMVYFVVCALLFAAASRPWRRTIVSWKAGLALAVGAAVFSGNVVWNAAHQFVSATHTEDVAAWSGSIGGLGEALAFFGSQFGVFGPILFAALIALAGSALMHRRAEPERLLLYFSVPVILIITTQAFMSRAYANWAATAYPAATVLVTAELLKDRWRRLFRTSLALHVVFVGVLFAGHLLAPHIRFGGRNPFWSMLGWSDIGAAVERRLDAGDYRAVLVDHRGLTAEMIYLLRDRPDIRVHAWLEPGRPPKSHFELMRPVGPATPTPILFVSARGPQDTLAHFSDVEPLGSENLMPTARGRRAISFYRLAGWQDRVAPAR